MDMITYRATRIALQKLVADTRLAGLRVLCPVRAARIMSCRLNTHLACVISVRCVVIRFANEKLL